MVPNCLRCKPPKRKGRPEAPLYGTSNTLASLGDDEHVIDVAVVAVSAVPMNPM